MSGYWRTYIIQEPFTYSTTVNGLAVERTGVRSSERREWVDVPDQRPVVPEPVHTFDSFEAAEDAFEGSLSSSILVREELLEHVDLDGDGAFDVGEVGAPLPLEAVGGSGLDEARVEEAVAAAAIQAVVVPAGADRTEAQALFDAAGQAAIESYRAHRDVALADGASAEEAIRRGAILARAEILSGRAMAGDIDFSQNDYLIMYEAAEIRTGVPSEVLRAMGTGESGAGLYEDEMPRHFLVLAEMAPANATGFACTNLTPGEGGAKIFTDGSTFLLSTSAEDDAALVARGFEVFPVVLGNDPGGTIGIGIHQLTLPRDRIVEGLASGQPVVLQGGDNQWPGIEIDVERAIRDPVYNIEMAGRLLQWARAWANFSDGLVPPRGMDPAAFYAENPGAPLPGDWGYIVAEAQGTTDDAVTSSRVVLAIDDPTTVPGWTSAEPDLYEVAAEEPNHPEAEDACRSR